MKSSIHHITILYVYIYILCCNHCNYFNFYYFLSCIKCSARASVIPCLPHLKILRSFFFNRTYKRIHNWWWSLNDRNMSCFKLKVVHFLKIVLGNVILARFFPRKKEVIASYMMPRKYLQLEKPINIPILAKMGGTNNISFLSNMWYKLP